MISIVLIRSSSLARSFSNTSASFLPTIRDYGVDEKYFLETLGEMSEQAFNDQCTGANPRYPLVSELKDIYLKAYYGEMPKKEEKKAK